MPRGYRTARSLARALGIDENRYTRYERAEVEPDLALIMRICEVLSITPNDLLIDGGAGRNGSVGITIDTTAPAAVEVETAQLSRRTAAWRLAQFVAHVEGGGIGDPPDTPSDLACLQRWSQLHAVIERDPFAFVASISADARFGQLTGDIERRFTALIGELTAAVDAHAKALKRA